MKTIAEKNTFNEAYRRLNTFLNHPVGVAPAPRAHFGMGTRRLLPPIHGAGRRGALTRQQIVDLLDPQVQEVANRVAGGGNDVGIFSAPEYFLNPNPHVPLRTSTIREALKEVSQRYPNILMGIPAYGYKKFNAIRHVPDVQHLRDRLNGVPDRYGVQGNPNSIEPFPLPNDAQNPSYLRRHRRYPIRPQYLKRLAKNVNYFYLGGEKIGSQKKRAYFHEIDKNLNPRAFPSLNGEGFKVSKRIRPADRGIGGIGAGQKADFLRNNLSSNICFEQQYLVPSSNVPPGIIPPGHPGAGNPYDAADFTGNKRLHFSPSQNVNNIGRHNQTPKQNTYYPGGQTEFSITPLSAGINTSQAGFHGHGGLRQPIRFPTIPGGLPETYNNYREPVPVGLGGMLAAAGAQSWQPFLQRENPDMMAHNVMHNPDHGLFMGHNFKGHHVQIPDQIEVFRPIEWEHLPPGALQPPPGAVLPHMPLHRGLLVSPPVQR